MCVCLKEKERLREGNSLPASKENAKKGDEMKAIFSFSKRKGVGISIVQQAITHTHTTKQNLTERTNIVYYGDDDDDDDMFDVLTYCLVHVFLIENESPFLCALICSYQLSPS